MCHLILLLPVISLPVLWLLPLPIALPMYGLGLVFALWVYVLAVKTAGRPVTTGAEGMIGERGRVMRVEGRSAMLQIHGELWFAEAAGEPLAVGETALVVGIDGLRLKARRESCGTKAPIAGIAPGTSGCDGNS